MITQEDFNMITQLEASDQRAQLLKEKPQQVTIIIVSNLYIGIIDIYNLYIDIIDISA